MVVSDVNGCESDTAFFDVTFIPSAISESQIADFSVYPNPSRNVFNVTFMSEISQDLEFRVINVFGEVIYTEILEKLVGEYKNQINLKNHPKAIYFFEIETERGVINKKLILQ